MYFLFYHFTTFTNKNQDFSKTSPQKILHFPYLNIVLSRIFCSFSFVMPIFILYYVVAHPQTLKIYLYFWSQFVASMLDTYFLL